MTRGRFYATAMPIYAIVWLIAIAASGHAGKVASIGVLGFALIAVLGTALFGPADGDGNPAAGRRRNRNRNRG